MLWHGVRRVSGHRALVSVRRAGGLLTAGHSDGAAPSRGDTSMGIWTVLLWDPTSRYWRSGNIPISVLEAAVDVVCQQIRAGQMDLHEMELLDARTNARDSKLLLLEQSSQWPVEISKRVAVRFPASFAFFTPPLASVLLFVRLCTNSVMIPPASSLLAMALAHTTGSGSSLACSNRRCCQLL